VNVLLVTLDQFRGDCLSAAGHPVVRTPNLDRLASEGVRLARHYSQSSPCSPGRACLYTGTYQLNNRVVANGTPLDARFDNLALAARRAGYTPTLFGYTDQSVDPREASGPDDPRLSSYEGVLPGSRGCAGSATPRPPTPTRCSRSNRSAPSSTARRRS
jgi:arylsulfatase A-like enzyme